MNYSASFICIVQDSNGKLFEAGSGVPPVAHNHEPQANRKNKNTEREREREFCKSQ